MAILRFYSKEAWEEAHRLKILKQLKNAFPNIDTLQVEKCYHVETTAAIEPKAKDLLIWLLKHPQGDESSLFEKTTLPNEKD
ncbi:hypothetical protein DOY81_013435, partial [Sarcophaga bullata]